MPRRRVVRRRYLGAGFLGSLWDGLKSVAGPINDVLKATHAISGLAPYIPIPGANLVGRAAGALGYGRRRKRKSGGMKVMAPYMHIVGNGRRRRKRRGGASSSTLNTMLGGGLLL